MLWQPLSRTNSGFVDGMAMRKMGANNEYLRESVKGAPIIVLAYRYTGAQFAWSIRNLKITPNQLSLIGFMFGCFSAVLFSLDDYRFLVCGTVLYQICIVLDYSDGSLARIKNMTSLLGIWLEAVFDPIREFLVVFGICWGLYAKTGNLMVWAFGLILCGTNYMMDIQILTFESFPFAEEGIRTFAPKSKLYKAAKQFISVRTTRYVAIILFAIMDRMFLFLVFFSIYNMLIFLLLAFQLGRVVKAQDNFDEPALEANLSEDGSHRNRKGG